MPGVEWCCARFLSKRLVKQGQDLSVHQTPSERASVAQMRVQGRGPAGAVGLEGTIELTAE